MRTPNLFDLPEPKPTRLEQAKQAHRIWTQYCSSDPVERRWLAARLPMEQWLSNSEMFKIEWVIEHDEQACAYAATEADAVIECARINGIRLAPIK